MAQTGGYQALLTSITGHYCLAIAGRGAGTYLQVMTYRTYESLAHPPLALVVLKGPALLQSIMFTTFLVIALATGAPAAELPIAPSSVVRTGAPMTVAPVLPSVPTISEANPVDKRFVSLSFVSASSTFADSYTTLFARQNWLAHKQGICNVEVQSPYLYGTHPTVGRAYAVASAKSAGSILAAFYMRKHRSRFWSLPLVANSLVSLQGVTQNMMACN
jgi:hypothetical protein